MADSFHAHVRKVVEILGPRAAYNFLLAESNALIRQPRVDNGREIAAARSAIYTVLVERWAAEQQRRSGYDRPFAVAALGGTGRAEVTPCSDLDFGLLFDDALDGNAFLLELQRQTLHTDEFQEEYGFSIQPLPFCLDEAPTLREKQLNSFIDLAPVYDPQSLVPRFRERIRATFDPFLTFLHLRGFWKKQWERAGLESERLDLFDIKNEGLRIFLAGIWTLAIDGFRPCHEIYRQLDDARDLEAYYLLLRIRSWVHLRRPPGGQADALGNHAEDLLVFEDFCSFGEMLGTDAGEREKFEFATNLRRRLLAARRRLMSFTHGIVERELRVGRRIKPGSTIALGTGGLYHVPVVAPSTDREKSRAALSMLLAAQQYDVPIDPAELQTTFRGAGDWLVPVPELAALFYEQRGSLAASFDFLSRLDGAVDRLFPGYGNFEASLDARVMQERAALRSALERRKMLALEQFIDSTNAKAALAIGGTGPKLIEGGPDDRVEKAIALLDQDHLAGIKLALKTKRLSVTPDDLVLRQDESRPRHERFASGFSGIPLEEYYRRYIRDCDFSPETIAVAEFLVRYRRLFKERSTSGINYETDVEDFVNLCGSEQRVCALYVFYCADRAEWGNARAYPPQWFIIRELFDKARRYFNPAPDPSKSLRAAGYEEQALEILRDFGQDFYSGSYRPQAAKFGGHLLRLSDPESDAAPKAALVRDGTSTMIGVAARDVPGVAASICGALWQQGVELEQAHLFSATRYGLALDFFHISTEGKPVPRELLAAVETAVRERKFIAAEDGPNIPRLAGALELEEPRPRRFRLRYESSRNSTGLVYALTYKVFQHLQGSIHGLSAHATRTHAYISIYLNLPQGRTLEEGREIVRRCF